MYLVLGVTAELLTLWAVYINKCIYFTRTCPLMIGPLMIGLYLWTNELTVTLFFSPSSLFYNSFLEIHSCRIALFCYFLPFFLSIALFYSKGTYFPQISVKVHSKYCKCFKFTQKSIFLQNFRLQQAAGQFFFWNYHNTYNQIH